MARGHLSNHKLAHKENHNKFQNIQKKFYKSNSQCIEIKGVQMSPNRDQTYQSYSSDLLYLYY